MNNELLKAHSTKSAASSNAHTSGAYLTMILRKGHGLINQPGKSLNSVDKGQDFQPRLYKSNK